MDGPRDLDDAALARLRNLGGEDLVRRMLALFNSYSRSRVEEALSAGGSYDLGAVERAAHALRSTAGNVGARHLYDVATGLERAAHQRLSAEVYVLLDELETACTDARSALIPVGVPVGPA
jgi:HPt (histidine-containing phosphotransfer) domain-containing protein